eukprot:COSAG01_NODE_4759_length_4760_cov_2.330401_3_plen_556_part_00
MPSLQRCSSNYLVSLHTPWLVQRRPTRALSGLVVCTGAADAVSRTEKACAALKNEIDEMSSQLVLVRAQKLTAQEQLEVVRERHQKKEEDMSSLVKNHREQQQRNEQRQCKVSLRERVTMRATAMPRSLKICELQEQEERRQMADRKSQALAELVQLRAQTESVDRQLQQAMEELESVRQAGEAHKQRATQVEASVGALRQDAQELSDVTSNTAQEIAAAESQVAVLLVKKDQLLKQAREVQEETGPMQTCTSSLLATVETLRTSNLACNAELSTEQNNLENAESQLQADSSSLEKVAQNQSDLQQEVSQLQSRRQATSTAIEFLEKHVTELVQVVSAARTQVAEESAERHKLESESDGLEVELKTLRAHSNMSATQQADALAHCKQRCIDLEREEAELLRESDSIESNMSAVESQVEESAGRLATLEAEAERNRQLRRKLRNAVSMLKQNIRSYVRVLPTTSAEGVDLGYARIENTSCDSDTLTVSAPPSSETDGRTEQSFSFDRVYSTQCSDAQILDDILDIVACALHGDNVCIMTCGHTGKAEGSTMVRSID